MGEVVRSRAKMIVAARAAGAATQTYLASILRAEQGGERTEIHAYLSTSCRAPPKSRASLDKDATTTPLENVLQHQQVLFILRVEA